MNLVLCGFTSPGFLHPLVAVGRAAAARRHRVLVVTSPDAAGLLSSAGLARHGGPSGRPGERLAFDIAMWARPEAVALQARCTSEAIAAARADAVVASALAIGPLLAAERAGLPAAVLGLMRPVWAVGTDPAGDPDSDRLQRNLEDLAGIYAAARRSCGLSPRRFTRDDCPLNGDALLLRSAPELEPRAGHLPDLVEFVGPCRFEPGDDDAGGRWLDAQRRDGRRRLVYVQLARDFGRHGSCHWSKLCELLATGEHAAVLDLERYDGPTEPWPAFARRARGGSSASLLRRCDAALGSATTTAATSALLAGRPLLALPGGGEQPLVATALERAGTLRLAAPGASLADELEALLATEAPARAEALGRRLAARGPELAVQRCEQLAAVPALVSL